VRAFWLLVLPLLALAGYLAVRVTREGDTLRRHELQALLDGRLADVRTRASHAMDAIERQLGEQLASAPTAPDELREVARKIPLANAIFRLDRDGRMQFPKGDADFSAAERDFLIRTRPIWTGRAILSGTTQPSDAASKRVHTAPGLGDSLVDLAEQDDHGWLSWYWAEGLHLLYWQRAGDGGVIGVELERIGVLSRVVGSLPTEALDDGRMELADSRGQTVHQWGALIPAEGAFVPRPDATIALEQPLESWSLRYYLAPGQREALVGGTDTGTLLGLGALGLAILALAIYIYREYTRRLREAAQRVGFVTRVSHELRTPLANIRIYAELLEDAVAEDDPDQQRRAGVIVSESERLGRLIDNVLAFGRPRRGKAEAVPNVDVDINTAVRDTVAKFEPALASRAIDVHVDLADGPATARAGAGAVEQIVTNLMSNVEKYAAGTEVTVTTRTVNGHIVVGVADHGPGVPAHERAKIFEPFHRASDALTDRTSGTGIGLAIARELARAAGGDLVLADADRGARFELTLPAAGDPP
jgi:signal transduction histidine kinase